MGIKSLLFPTLLAALTAGCSTTVREQAAETATQQQTLIGKKAMLTYPEFEAEVSYLTDSTVHWKTVDTNGIVAQSNEKSVYKRLNDHQFFVSWIERSGETVSQVVDMENNTVTVFLSYHDDASDRGKRSGTLVEGAFALILK